MEHSRPLPSGGVGPERLKSLIGHPGPILTASMPLDPAEPDAIRRADERAAALVREELSSNVAARVHPIAATRAPGGDDSAEAKEIERTLADLAARRTVDALRMVRERLDDGGAVEGTEDVLAALRQSQVALLLFSDQPGDDVAFVPDRPDVVGREDLAEVVGAGGDSPPSEEVALTRCPVADAAVAAAVATGAEVRLVPGEVGRGSLHALLRWDREPEEGPA